MVDDLSEIAEYGERFGVVIGIQNHGDFLKTADETIELLQGVDSRWIGVIVDTGYFLSPDPYSDIERVMPYAVNFRIKEHARVCPSPYMKPLLEPTDLNRLLMIIRESGYPGYLPIETLSASSPGRYEPLEVVPEFLNQVRKAIADTA